MYGVRGCAGVELCTVYGVLLELSCVRCTGLCKGRAVYGVRGCVRAGLCTVCGVFHYRLCALIELTMIPNKVLASLLRGEIFSSQPFNKRWSISSQTRDSSSSSSTIFLLLIRSLVDLARLLAL